MQGLSYPCLLCNDFCNYAGERISFSTNAIVFEANKCKPKQVLLPEPARELLSLIVDQRSELMSMLISDRWS